MVSVTDVETVGLIYIVVMKTAPAGGVGAKSAGRYSHWHILLPEAAAFSGQELAPPVYVGLEPGKMYCGVCALASMPLSRMLVAMIRV